MIDLFFTALEHSLIPLELSLLSCLGLVYLTEYASQIG